MPQSQLPVVSVYGQHDRAIGPRLAAVARAQHHGLAAVVVVREPLLVVDGHEIARPQPPHVHLVVRVRTRRVDVDDAVLHVGDLHASATR